MSDKPMRLSAEPSSWTFVLELYERGDPVFVDELRNVRDPEVLGPFARHWFADTRPVARRLLLAYLERPLNALRHEVLVKRLFKLAEDAGDDEVMGRFLLLFDLSIRRVRLKRRRYDRVLREFSSGEMASTPNAVMPRLKPEDCRHLNERQQESFPQLRLFSVATRQYLRRRAWRYFRKLGRTNPTRYLATIPPLLTLYTNEDVKDGLALLDNWGLVHILFHFSPALLSKPTGWVLVAGKSLAEVKAEPMFVKHWQSDAQPLLDLLDQAAAKAVRLWAIQMLEAHHPQALGRIALEKLVAWLGHASPEMVALAVRLLNANTGLNKVDPQRLIHLLQHAGSETLELLCGLVAKVIKPKQVSVAQAVTLARSRPLVLAQFGFKLLQGKKLASPEDCAAALLVVEAEASQLRAEMVRWVCTALAHAPEFQSTWIVELLDSRHADVRRVGWQWLQDEPRAAQDVVVWQRLLESPYDDVRLQMIAHLETLTQGAAEDHAQRQLDDALVRLLWATVLLNVARGARNKQLIVKQLLTRLERAPSEVPLLLPLLGVALRSLRGPEFRAGLVGVVQWVRRHPDREATVTQLFPELKLATIQPGCVGPDWSAFLAPKTG